MRDGLSSMIALNFSFRILVLWAVACAGLLFGGEACARCAAPVEDAVQVATCCGWDVPALVEPSEELALEAGSGVRSDSTQSKKRYRRCWRPDSTVSILVGTERLPLQVLSPELKRREYHRALLSDSDLLLMLGGYTRLFQKG